MSINQDSSSSNVDIDSYFDFLNVDFSEVEALNLGSHETPAPRMTSRIPSRTRSIFAGFYASDVQSKPCTIVLRAPQDNAGILEQAMHELRVLSAQLKAPPRRSVQSSVIQPMGGDRLTASPSCLLPTPQPRSPMRGATTILKRAMILSGCLIGAAVLYSQHHQCMSDRVCVWALMQRVASQVNVQSRQLLVPTVVPARSPQSAKNSQPSVTTQHPANAQPAVASTNPFRDAVNTATAAAELTQTATTPEEWRIVANHWLSAIALMNSVPPSSPSYQTALAKIEEYAKNLAYAQRTSIEVEGIRAEGIRAEGIRAEGIDGISSQSRFLSSPSLSNSRSNQQSTQLQPFVVESVSPVLP